MAIAAALELARIAEVRGISETRILPRMDEWEAVPRIAVAVASKARQQNVARLEISPEQVYRQASTIIRNAREMTQTLMRENLIPSAKRERNCTGSCPA
jgi:malic enzyme